MSITDIIGEIIPISKVGFFQNLKFTFANQNLA